MFIHYLHTLYWNKSKNMLKLTKTWNVYTWMMTQSILSNRMSADKDKDTYLLSIWCKRYEISAPELFSIYHIWRGIVKHTHTQTHTYALKEVKWPDSISGGIDWRSQGCLFLGKVGWRRNVRIMLSFIIIIRLLHGKLNLSL